MSGNEKLLHGFLVLLWILYTHGETTSGDGCGHAVLGPESGVLSSKNYPRTYPNHTWCQWRIQVPAGRRVALRFGDLDVEAQSCQYSYVRIQKGYGGEQGFDTFCGSRKPPIDLHVDTNQLIVQFRSGTHISGRGFLLSYSTVQNQDLLTCLDMGGHFSPPKYPKYPKYRKYCPAGCRGVAGDVSGDISQGYRHTSVLCKAAVHAGVIQDETGGWVSVETHKGQSHYPATRANGVQSKDGSLSDSLFTFISNECKKESALRPVAVNASTWQQLSTWPPSNASSSGSRAQAADRAAGSVGEAERGVSAVLWVAKQNDALPWLQLDLGEKKRVTGIITMGSSWMKTHDYIKTYRIELKEKNRWRVWAQNNMTDFEGNQDCLHQTRNNFHPSIVTRYLRLIPLSWDQHIAIRVEVLGCTNVRANVSTQMMVETQPTRSKPTLADTQPGPLHVDTVNITSHQTLGTQPTKPKPPVPGQDTQPVPSDQYMDVDIANVSTQMMVETQPTRSKPTLADTQPGPLHVDTVNITSHQTLGTQPTKPKPPVPGQDTQPVPSDQYMDVDIVKLAIIIVPTLLSVVLLLTGICIFKMLHKKQNKDNSYGSSEVKTGCWKQIKQPFARHQSTEFTISYSSDKEPIHKLDMVTSSMAEYQQPLMIGMGTMSRKGSTFRPMDTEASDGADPATHYDYLHTANQYALPLTNQEPEYATPIIERHAFRKDGFLPDAGSYSVPGTVGSKSPPSFRASEGSGHRKPGLGGGSRGYQTPQLKRTERSGQNSAGLYDCPKVAQNHSQGERLDSRQAADYQQPQAKPLVMESYSTPRDCVRRSPVSAPAVVGLHRPDPEGGCGGGT